VSPGIARSAVVNEPEDDTAPLALDPGNRGGALAAGLRLAHPLGSGLVAGATPSVLSRRYRTQEVVDSSPTSSIAKRPALAGLWFARVRTKSFEIRRWSSFGQVDPGGSGRVPIAPEVTGSIRAHNEESFFA